MSNECKLRFKGVENFLRKLAFNLGNTASQTEVKIISCIPIDVTDLQQKITQLEKELESTTQQETVPQKSIAQSKTITQKLSVPKESIFTSGDTYKHVNNVAISCNRLFPSEYGEDTHSQNNSVFWSSELCTKTKPEPAPEPQEVANAESEPAPEPQEVANAESELTEQVEQQPANFKAHVGFFRKKRRLPKKRNTMNPQMVYYTQNQVKTPFDYYLPGDDTSKMRGKKDSNNVNKSDYNDVYRKLYNHMPAALLGENANESEFSTPICRDVLPTKTVSEIQLPESDLCSCCYGPFQNVDNHVHRHNHFNLAAPRRENRNAYYDSNLYDVVPVKENAPKVKHDVIKRHEPNNSVNIACWPEKTRPKYKIPRVISTHHTQPPTRHQIKILRKVPTKLQCRKDVAINKVPRIKPTYNPSKTRSVEFSEIYAKRLMKTRRKIAKVANKEATKRRDRACLTTAVITNTECQTISLSRIQPKEQKCEEDVKATTKHLGNETDVTLNQIKNILQTVLAEVKTNSKISNVPEHEKKDAIVQNGPSQSHIFGGSSFLHSFTYSPYNINSYGASCSRQIPTSCYPPSVPTSPIKCMQYPLFVQPGRNMCTNCYKNNPLSFNNPLSHPLNISSNVRQATSAATNTEQSRSRSQETENLIKEIYKSMALYQDSSKEARVSEPSDVGDNLKRFESSTSEEREAKFIAKAISEIFKNTKPIETSETRSISSPDSKVTSDHQSKDEEVRENIFKYNSDNEKSDSADSDEAGSVKRGLRSDEYDDDSNCTIINKEESDSDVTETESRVLKTKPEEIQKTNLFSKMLKIFKPKSRPSHFKTRVTKNIKVVEEETSESGSTSDLQSEYSHRSAYSKPVHKSGRHRQRRKVFATKQQRHEEAPQIKPIARRSPYMEQEYRRYFDEKLTFRDNREARFPSTRHTPQKPPVYYQEIDARSVLTNAYPSHAYNYRTGTNIPARGHSPPKVMHTSRYSPGRVMTQGPGNSPPRAVPRGPGKFTAKTTRYDNGNSPDRSYWYDRGNSPERVNWYNRGISPNRRLWYDRGISPDRAMAQDAGRYAPRMNVRQDNGNQSVGKAQLPELSTSPAKLSTSPAKLSASPKAMAWLKKQKIGIRCGQQWKRLILEG